MARSAAAPRVAPAAARRRRRAARATQPVALALPPPDAAAAALGARAPGLAVGALANSAVFGAGLRVLLGGLTPTGVAHAWVLGTSVFAAFGAGGYALVCVYFLAGSAVTKLKLEQKQREGIAEARSGRRAAGSVWGSGVAGVLCAAAALAGLPPGDAVWRLAFVASFASKLGDTTASEVGKAYGKTTYLSTTFRRVPRGTEGAVSLEGTVAGLAAAAALSALAMGLGQIDARGVAVATACAFASNTFESMLGAVVQDKVEWLTNDVVNAIQICVAAALAVAMSAALT